MVLECRPPAALERENRQDAQSGPTSPTFIIAGAARSGTSSLHSWLGQHPDVFMSPIKETNYFAQLTQPFTGPGDERPRAPLQRDEAGGLIPRGAAYIVDAEEYRSVFAGSESFSACGEASPSYLYYPRCAAAIRHALPDCKIVIVLREPIDRLVSSYNALCTWGRESGSLALALELEDRRIQQGWEWIWDLSGGSLYASMIEPYLAAFPREQVRVWLFEDLKERPGDVYGSICDFIGVDPSRAHPRFTAENTSVAGPRLAGLTRTMPRLTRAFTRLPPGLRTMARPWAARLLAGNEAALPSSEVARLVELYEDETARLERLLPELDFSPWRERRRRRRAP